MNRNWLGKGVAGICWRTICMAGAGNAVGGVRFLHLLGLREQDEPWGHGE